MQTNSDIVRVSFRRKMYNFSCSRCGTESPSREDNSFDISSGNYSVAFFFDNLETFSPDKENVTWMFEECLPD